MEDPWLQLYNALLQAKEDGNAENLRKSISKILVSLPEGDTRAKEIRQYGAIALLNVGDKEGMDALITEVGEKAGVKKEGERKTSGTPSVYLVGHSWGNGITDYGRYDFSKHNMELHSDSGKDTVDGMGMDAALARLKKSGSYDAVAVLIGINDYLAGYGTFTAKFQKIIDEAFAHGKEVFIFNIPHYSGANNEKLDKVNAWLKEQEAANPNLHIIDIASLHKNGALHPSSYGKFRDAFIRSLKDVYPDVISQKLDYVPAKKTAANEKSEKKKLLYA